MSDIIATNMQIVRLTEWDITPNGYFQGAFKYIFILLHILHFIFYYNTTLICPVTVILNEVFFLTNILIKFN